jgi:hypothetical protein
MGYPSRRPNNKVGNIIEFIVLLIVANPTNQQGLSEIDALPKNG